MRKPVVGETLYASTRNGVMPVEVTAVGRKYFTVRINYWLTRFHLDTWREVTAYSSTIRLYESEQVWMDELEADILRGKIGNAFSVYGFRAKIPLPALRQIAGILGITPEDDTITNPQGAKEPRS